MKTKRYDSMGFESEHGIYVRWVDHEATERDAARYRWLRDDNAYCPEESQVRGGDDLDRLCDKGKT